MKELLAHASNFLSAPDYDADQKTRLKARVEQLIALAEEDEALEKAQNDATSAVGAERGN